METESTLMPQEFIRFMDRKLEKNREGRPHFMAVLGKEGRNVMREVLNILELAWIKQRSLRSIARKYTTSYDTIRRFLNDLETLGLKGEIIRFLMSKARSKIFYNPQSETSDYETVTNYIQRCKRFSVKKFHKQLQYEGATAWKALGRRNPTVWTADEVMNYLKTLKPGAASGALDAIRQIAPQISNRHSRHYICTSIVREKLKRHKKDIFAMEVGMIIMALRCKGLTWHETVFKLHVTLGAREGKTNPDAGMSGLLWSYAKKKFTKMDLWESKVRGGLWSHNCPLDHLFSDLPKKLHKVWIERGMPTDAKIIEGGYEELRRIYIDIAEVVANYWKGNTEPDVLQEFQTLKPHDSGRIHVNLLWEAKVPLEVVAGQDLGRGEGIGLVGRIWLSTDTIKKYYLSLTQRSERFQEIKAQIMEYSKRLNGKERAKKGQTFS